ncbi:IS1 family transposase [Escherichia coli]|uniref:IS1 family transposase n=1 Tax=Escherichia coli TaxID=562 RepID=UPI00388D5327
MTSSSARNGRTKAKQCWLFYAYDRLRKTVALTYSVNALWRRWGVFYEPVVTSFDVVIWMI